jgi:ketol-acid reductoisomerase
VTRGPRVVTEQTKAAMKEVLAEIQSGQFAKEWMAEVRAGMPNLQQLVEKDRQHPLEVAGRKLRGMMSWLSGNRLVDRKSN